MYLNISVFLFENGIVSNHHNADTYEFRLGGLKNCKVIFPYFDKFKLYTKKSVSYNLWKELHESLINKDHLDPFKRPEAIKRARLINNSSLT